MSYHADRHPMCAPNNNYVGDVFRQHDILNPGQAFFVLHFEIDPGGPRRVYERHRIREVAQLLVDTHPYR